MSINQFEISKSIPMHAIYKKQLLTMYKIQGLNHEQLGSDWLNNPHLCYLFPQLILISYPIASEAETFGVKSSHN